MFLALAFAYGYFLGGKEGSIRKVVALGTAQRNLSAALLIGSTNFSSDPDVMVMILSLGFIGLFVLMITAGELGKGE